ncbi:uncharacterized protein BDR25DRAFT_331044 [Lindgomyces ingoldianus]|uniref:Uncharacterized protein n=1 Tax=Lindgomyces ingoldianus TaxID=673940 RepID=A0ACB6RDR7_9PLEO|nr:uncharacterized protein BDR25DRAFT_331044 [Lindgomyces ingoldianus]KAF2477257.1 hypothetical protein BDR25DRAFT_331044 [Lindgomyces ingoldianus]
MGVPSTQASNAIIYLTYAAFLCVDFCAATLRALSFDCPQDSSVFATQGIRDNLDEAEKYPLGSGILFTYPQIATICGVQGLVVYAIASALPLLIFGFLGPIIRRKCPEGFVLTEWTRQRYGAITALFLSLCTLITIFLYMVAELSAMQQIITALTGLDGLPAVIVECAVTTIYTSIGGFRVSFVTDNIQGAMVVLLIILGVITVGVETHIDRRLINQSGFLNSSLLGWQLIYILPVAILTNDFFISGFWLRTFASRTDKDLWIGVSIASVAVCIILTLVGATGLLAAWSGAWKLDDAEGGYLAFFLLLGQLPAWVVGIVLVMVVSLSTAAFDSFQSAMISTGSNDLFRNKLSLWVIRALVVVIIIPVVAVALKSPDILQIFLISDLVSASVVPVLVLGLVEKFYWWRGFEVVVGGLGGIFTVFLFGLVYYNGDANLASKLILLEGGLYANDWSAFGAFVAAPIGGLLWGFGACGLRILILYIISRIKGHRFNALDKPAPENPFVETYEDNEHERVLEQTDDIKKSGNDVRTSTRRQHIQAAISFTCSLHLLILTPNPSFLLNLWFLPRPYTWTNSSASIHTTMEMPDVPVNVPIDDPNADTEWNDILRKHGVIPEKPPSPTPMIEEALEEARRLAHENRLEGKDLDELAELEDEEDEEFLEHYRNKRFQELSTINVASVYNQVFHIQKPDYSKDVAEASNKAHILVFLTSSQGTNVESRVLTEIWRDLARRFGDIKFCQIRADMCIEGYPEKNTPTILIYKDGDIKKQLVTLRELRGVHTTAADLEKVLVDVGAVRHGDPRLRPQRTEDVDASASRKIRQGKASGKDGDDDDSDWD